MRPLNYAMLKYFTTVDEASVDDVMKDLEADYSTFTAFKPPPSSAKGCRRPS